MYRAYYIIADKQLEVCSSTSFGEQLEACSSTSSGEQLEVCSSTSSDEQLEACSSTSLGEQLERYPLVDRKEKDSPAAFMANWYVTVHNSCTVLTMLDGEYVEQCSWCSIASMSSSAHDTWWRTYWAEVSTTI